jgi:hypothetical protein
LPKGFNVSKGLGIRARVLTAFAAFAAFLDVFVPFVAADVELAERVTLEAAETVEFAWRL